jgi:hypothetical protein
MEPNNPTPQKYSVDFVGQDAKDGWTKWRNFRYPWVIEKKEFDPTFDYTSLWPQCVNDASGCTPVDVTDYFGLAIVLLIGVGGLISIIVIYYFRGSIYKLIQKHKSLKPGSEPKEKK